MFDEQRFHSRQRCDPIGRPRLEFVSGDQCCAMLADLEQRSLEGCIGAVDGANARGSRHRTGADEAAVDVQLVHSLHGGAIDTPADQGVDQSPDQDELQIVASEQGSPDVQRIGCNSQLVVVREVSCQRQVGARTVEKQKLTRLNRPCGGSCQSQLAFVAYFSPRCQRGRAGRYRQRASIDTAAQGGGGGRAGGPAGGGRGGRGRRGGGPGGGGGRRGGTARGGGP